MEEFIFYVVSAEWVKLGSGFLHIRGSLIHGDFHPGGLNCIEPISGQKLRINGEGLLPNRAGSELKMLAHAMRERVFTSTDRPSGSLNGCILFSGKEPLISKNFRISIKHCSLSSSNEPPLVDFVYPVSIEQLNAFGLLFFENGRSLLKIFGCHLIQGDIDLSLLNNPAKDITFKVTVEKNK